MHREGESGGKKFKMITLFREGGEKRRLREKKKKAQQKARGRIPKKKRRGDVVRAGRGRNPRQPN